MEQTKSFFEIISNNIIEIPIIQREYAQGRLTDKVKEIRERIVRDLVSSVETNEELHLGFIYGKIEGKENLIRKKINKDAVSSILEAVRFYANNLDLKIDTTIEDLSNSDNQNAINLKFIPLDGQQRLTTLFLLHWYLYLKGGKVNNAVWLDNFKYTNRKSALAFCKELVREDNIAIIRKKQKNSPKTNIKEIIFKASFYLKKWTKDATVSGMLEMLSSIEQTFKPDFDFSKIDVENLPFKFDFMDLDSLNQTDELYVKMNSRGKQLSDYEHFKSWIQEKNKDSIEKEWLKSFWKKLDTDWLNYFWRNIDESFSALDNFYYNFIKNLALMHSLATNNSIPFDNFKELYGLVRNSEVYDSNKISYIPLEKYNVKWKEGDIEKSFFIFNLDTLKFIEKTFESLIYLEKENTFDKLELEDILCNPFIDNKITDLFLKSKLFTPSLWNTVFYYSFIVFINDRDSNDYSLVALKEWLRYNRNLIYNTYIQNLDNFNNAMRQINYLSSFKFNLSESILSGEIKNSYFDSEQFQEEKLKLQLFSDDSWSKSIRSIENHSYFYGQIKFLLDFAKDESGNYNVQNFLKYSIAISRLFDDEIRNSKKKLLERFLLCESFYLPNYKSDNIFCSPNAGGLRARNENWRLFFKSDKVITLKNAIDKLDITEINTESLNKYINDYLHINDLEPYNSKYLFLKYPQAISYCSESAIRKNSENDIRLLKGFPITAYHSELRSYCFFKEHKDKEATDYNRKAPKKFAPFGYFWHFEDKNTDGHPGCYLEGFKYHDKEYKLDIRFSKSGNTNFELCFYHKAIDVENRNSDINLVTLDYTFNEEYKHYFKSIDYAKILIELENLCTYLNTL